jgi:hypothetical protein
VTENQVDEALARGQLARILGVQKELGEAQIVSALQRLVPGERLVPQVEEYLGEGRIVLHSMHAGRGLAHLGQHAVVADPAIEAVQLKVDADVRVQIVIPDPKGDGGSRRDRWVSNTSRFKSCIWICFDCNRGIHFKLLLVFNLDRQHRLAHYGSPAKLSQTTPPPAWIFWPVTHRLSSPARKITTSATSFGVPMGSATPQLASRSRVASSWRASAYHEPAIESRRLRWQQFSF